MTLKSALKKNICVPLVVVIVAFLLFVYRDNVKSFLGIDDKEGFGNKTYKDKWVDNTGNGKEKLHGPGTNRTGNIHQTNQHGPELSSYGLNGYVCHSGHPHFHQGSWNGNTDQPSAICCKNADSNGNGDDKCEFKCPTKAITGNNCPSGS